MGLQDILDSRNTTTETKLPTAPTEENTTDNNSLQDILDTRNEKDSDKVTEFKEYIKSQEEESVSKEMLPQSFDSKPLNYLGSKMGFVGGSNVDKMVVEKQNIEFEEQDYLDSNENKKDNKIMYIGLGLLAYFIINK